MGDKRLYKVVKNEALGRYLVATTKLKQGQLILKENPVLLAPQLGGCTICFNCCAQIKKVYACLKCPAILCNPQCIGQLHTPEECSTLKSTPLKPEDLLTNADVITPLRCLLWKSSNKDCFQRLLNLENHLDQRRDAQIYRRIRINIEEVLHKLKLIDDDDLKSEIVQKICGVLDTNTFDVRQPQRNRSGFSPGENLRGLYLKAAIMAHDCVANAHVAVDDDFVLYIHAAVDIPEGAPITFNYANVLHGNVERKKQLQDGKYFQCGCSRCLDPSELKTEISSLKCPRCLKGTLRPPSWSCLSCKRTYHPSVIKTTLMECRRRIDEIENVDITTLETLLSRLALTFHPHHHLVLEVEQSLVRLYTQAPNVKTLRKKIDLCKKFLEIFRKVEPGISRIQAVALYELHSGVVSLARLTFKEVGEVEFMKMLFMAEDTLKNCIKYLLYEPVKSPEGRLAQNALSELKMLRMTINNFQAETKDIERSKDKDKDKESKNENNKKDEKNKKEKSKNKKNKNRN